MRQLAQILDGWNGYQSSLLLALKPLSGEQLSWRPAPDRRSVGEVARHICMGRVTWLSRMDAPGVDKVAERVPKWHIDEDGTRRAAEESVPSNDPVVLAEWLDLSWQPIDRVLQEWLVDDLSRSYLLDGFNVSRQWTIWRIMSHDIHHGGQLTTLLAMQGLAAHELGTLGGHTVLPPLAGP